MGNSTRKKRKWENAKDKNNPKNEEVINNSPVCYASDDEVQSDYKIAVEKGSPSKAK